jgi:p38 MAP kinase
MFCRSALEHLELFGNKIEFKSNKLFKNLTNLIFSSAVDTIATEELGKEIRVVIKSLKDPFETINSAKRTNREICLLKHVSHDNVIKLIDVFTNSDTPENLNNV